MIRGFYIYVLYPLALTLLQLLRPFLNGKAREMIEDKNQGVFVLKNNAGAAALASARPFWIHAASGEIEYARPVIRELKKNFPEVPLLVTFSSPSAKKILSGLSEVDAWGPLPWDQKKSCRKFLDRWQPRCCLIARTDVWPVMAEMCREKAIPSLLFSATFASNSSRLRGLSARVTAWALNQLSEIHCVSAEDVKELQSLSLRVPVQIHGDTRFDQVFHRLEHPKAVKTELKPSGALPVLVAGSTWEEDERILLPAFKALQGRCKWILAPHEVHASHLNSLCAELDNAGLRYCRYSTAKVWGEEDVLLIDQVGILAELYLWGTLAFVGGSFRKQVHSVMEPLAAGLPVVVGPCHQNNREALVFKEKTLAERRVVTVVQSTEEMTAALPGLLEKPAAEFSAALHRELAQHQHSSLDVVAWCRRVL